MEVMYILPLNKVLAICVSGSSAILLHIVFTQSLPWTSSHHCGSGGLPGEALCSPRAQWATERGAPTGEEDQKALGCVLQLAEQD